jgi:hypothetical protein
VPLSASSEKVAFAPTNMENGKTLGKLSGELL